MKKKIITAVLVTLMAVFMITPALAILDNTSAMSTVYANISLASSKWYESNGVVILIIALACGAAILRHYVYKHYHESDSKTDNSDTDNSDTYN